MGKLRLPLRLPIVKGSYWFYRFVQNLTGDSNFETARHLTDLMWIPHAALFVTVIVGTMGDDDMWLIRGVFLFVLALLAFTQVAARKTINTRERLAEHGGFPTMKDLDRAMRNVAREASWIIFTLFFAGYFFIGSENPWLGLYHLSLACRYFLDASVEFACVDVGRETKEHVLKRVFKRKAVLKPVLQGN